MLAALLAAPSLAQAQATGTPTFFAPSRGFSDAETGISVSGGGGAGQIGIEGRFGFALNRSDVSLRGGYVDGGNAGDGSLVAGLEVRVPVIGHDRGFPLDGALILGVGRYFESGGETLVPVGLAVGRRIRLDGNDLQLALYAQPTVIIQSNSVFGVGLGVDVRIRGLPDIRLNWGTGDLDGFSVSMYWSG